MKFEIKNRFSGEVQLTAEIDADESTSTSIKIGLAVKWSIENGINLRNADLCNANLCNANLCNANLCNANLSNANLSNTNLSNANLMNANLYSANLYSANLYSVDLSNANLKSADLSNANLSNANLMNANLMNANLCSAYLCNANLYSVDLSNANLMNSNLYSANLCNANLCNANLCNANLSNTIGDQKYLKTIQIETYSISYTSNILQIGCEKHSISDWFRFNDKQIVCMDGNNALKFWSKWKDWIFQAIELSPAKPTGYVETDKEEITAN